MSILDFLCVLWDYLETLFLKLISSLGDGDGEDRSWIHPEHRLQLTKCRDPFYCTACKEIGFGRSYACEPCAVHIHKECMSPPPATSHPLPEYPGDLSFVRSIKNYDTDTGDDDDDGGGSGGSKICGACSKPLRGCGYMSAGGKSSFHPCCLHLGRFIKINGEKLKLKTKNVSSKCNWCKNASVRARGAVVPSWSYVSVGKDRRFHVGCVQAMILDSWRDGCMRGNEEDDDTNFTTCLCLKIQLPIDTEEERDANPSESAAQAVADLILKDIHDGKDPLAAALGDEANTRIKVLQDSLRALTSGVGSGSSKVWEVTKLLGQLLLLKIRQGIDWLADTPVGRAGRQVWTTVTQPSKLWELIRPVLRWVCSELCELANLLIGTSSPLGRHRHDAQAYLMDSI